MKNKEIEELLNNFQEVLDNPKYTDETYNGKLIEFDKTYDLEQDEIKILLSYIEQLEKELKEEQEDNYKQSELLVEKQQKIEQLEKENEKANKYIDFYKDLTEKQNKSLEEFKQENKQLENNRDKAIKYNKNILKENWYGGYEKENAQKNIDILKGDSDDK